VTTSRAQLRFDARLYSSQAVRRAAADFAGVARVTVRSDRGGDSVTLVPLGASLGARALADEFANHVLARTVEARRR
jgi:hypothetical protein